jgi:hypothetical protein
MKSSQSPVVTIIESIDENEKKYAFLLRICAHEPKQAEKIIISRKSGCAIISLLPKIWGYDNFTYCPENLGVR